MHDSKIIKSTCGKLAAIAMSILCMAALPSWADTNITEHVKLTEDADWTSLGTVNIAADASIHLNGRNLTVAGFSGSGSIYSSAVLPAGYAVLEYVESTGTQYIDTGVKAVTEVKIVADVTYTGNVGTGIYNPLISAGTGNVGRTDTSKTYGLWVWPVSNESKWVMFYNGAQYNSSSPVKQNERCTIEASWKGNSRTFKYDGTQTLNNTLNVNNPTAINETMYLPARNLGGNVNGNGAFKIYSFKIYNPQTTLVRDYVPAKRLSDNAVGFYDKVNNTFSPSATETAFVDGPEVERSGGELRINVASGTFKNSTVAISNSVKVVKLGAGTYASNKQQYYTGGTFVSEGRITLESTDMALYSVFGKWGTEVLVASKAQVLAEKGGFQLLNGYKVTIAGDGPDGNGAIYGKAKQYGRYIHSFIGGLSLSGDASISTIADDAFNLNNNGEGIDIALNGHTLTANGTARFIVWSANVVDTGRIVVAIAPGSDGAHNCFYTYGNGVSAPLVDFEVTEGKALGGEQPLTVSNLVMRGTYYPYNGASYLVTVLGRYSPKSTSGGFPKVTLGDATHLAPTLDISDLSSTYDGISREISFASDAAVAVEIGVRNVRGGDKLVSWQTKPDSTVKFTLAKNGETVKGRRLVVEDDGLYVGNGGMIITFH